MCAKEDLAKKYQILLKPKPPIILELSQLSCESSEWHVEKWPSTTIQVTGLCVFQVGKDFL